MDINVLIGLYSSFWTVQHAFICPPLIVLLYRDNKVMTLNNYGKGGGREERVDLYTDKVPRPVFTRNMHLFEKSQLVRDGTFEDSQ